MSQPDRYEPRARSIGGPWKMVKCKDGAYVCFEQHEEIVAALAAENEQVKQAGLMLADTSKAVVKQLIDQVFIVCEQRDTLAAENERLRKAGDAMAEYIKGYSLADKQDFPRQVFAWEAAKGEQP